jgi:hypothetical protein
MGEEMRDEEIERGRERERVDRVVEASDADDTDNESKEKDLLEPLMRAPAIEAI